MEYNDKDFLLELKKYYDLIYSELKNNKDFKQQLTAAEYHSSNLFFTSEEIIKVICLYKYNYKYNYGAYSQRNDLSLKEIEIKKAIDVIGRNYHNNFIDKLIASKLIIINAKEHISGTTNFAYMKVYKEEESLNDFYKKIETVMEIRSRITDPLMKDVFNFGIMRMYHAIFVNFAKFNMKNGKDSDIYEHGVEIYNNMSKFLETCDNIINDGDYVKKFLKRNKVQGDNLKQIKIMMKKMELMDLNRVSNQKVVVACLNDISKIKNELNDSVLAANFMELLNGSILSSLYASNNKEKNEGQTEITNILLPLMGKERQSGLTLLKGPIKRNKLEEQKLEEKEEGKVNINFILDLKKNHKALKRFMERTSNFYDITSKSDEKEVKLKMIKINNSLSNIALLVDKSMIENLSEKNLYDLREKMIDRIYGELNKYLSEVENVNYYSDKILETLREIPNIFLKELRASEIQTGFESIEKEKTALNKKKI